MLNYNAFPPRFNLGVKKGFSFIEIIVTVAILVVIIAMGVSAYSKFLDGGRLNTAAEGAVSIIQKAREYTLSSRENSFYSIHIEDKNVAGEKNYFQLFRANDYSKTNKRSEKYSLPQGTEVTSIHTETAISPSAGNNVTYERLSGNLVIASLNPLVATSTITVGTITIRSTGSGRGKIITLSPAGLIKITDAP